MKKSVFILTAVMTVLFMGICFIVLDVSRYSQRAEGRKPFRGCMLIKPGLDSVNVKYAREQLKDSSHANSAEEVSDSCITK